MARPAPRPARGANYRRRQRPRPAAAAPAGSHQRGPTAARPRRAATADGEQSRRPAHAQAALDNGYCSHWDRWGLKPQHRRNLAGDSNAGGENIAFQTPVHDLTRLVHDTVNCLLDSPGHRRQMLNPAHRVLHTGIACDPAQPQRGAVLVQQFSGDYVARARPPRIDKKGVLHLDIALQDARLRYRDDTVPVQIQIGWDPPPRTLTTGALTRTHSLRAPEPVAYIVAPPKPNQRYVGDGKRTQTVGDAVDPYGLPPEPEAVDCRDEISARWQAAKAQCEAMPDRECLVQRIIADRFDISEDATAVAVKADLSEILRRTGPGIYALTLWAQPTHLAELKPVAHQTLFRQTTPPAGNPYGDGQPRQQRRAQGRQYA